MEFETSTKQKSSDFERAHLKEDIYFAELKEVKDISDGQYGARVAFIYKIVDPKANGEELALVCYKTKATTENKLGQTLQAHGFEINDEKVNTSVVPNSKVRAWIEDFEYEFEVNGQQQKKVASTISKVKILVG